MPRFNYNCNKCKAEFELMIYLTDEYKDLSDELKCSKCGSLDIVKKIEFPIVYIRGRGIKELNDTVVEQKGLSGKDYFGDGGGFKTIHDCGKADVPKNDYRLAPLPQERIEIS